MPESKEAKLEATEKILKIKTSASQFIIIIFVKLGRKPTCWNLDTQVFLIFFMQFSCLLCVKLLAQIPLNRCQADAWPQVLVSLHQRFNRQTISSSFLPDFRLNCVLKCVTGPVDRAHDPGAFFFFLPDSYFLNLTVPDWATSLLLSAPTSWHFFSIQFCASWLLLHQWLTPSRPYPPPSSPPPASIFPGILLHLLLITYHRHSSFLPPSPCLISWTSNHWHSSFPHPVLLPLVLQLPTPINRDTISTHTVSSTQHQPTAPSGTLLPDCRNFWNKVTFITQF